MAAGGSSLTDRPYYYVVGYEELTGERADLVEVLNLDQKAHSQREIVNDQLLSGIRAKIQHAGEDLRANHLPRLNTWCETCDRCDLAGLCRQKP
jgi:DNA helicase II / ATP-dependent DNA helicase PcrA